MEKNKREQGKGRKRKKMLRKGIKEMKKGRKLQKIRN
jgi:hypothetical protein